METWMAEYHANNHYPQAETEEFATIMARYSNSD